MLTRRHAVLLSLLFCLSTNLPAQQANAVAAGDAIRFAAPAGVCQIRLQVISPAGESVFDSEWRDGSVFDWQAASADRPLSGSYRCVVTMRDLDGKVSEKEATLAAAGGRISVESAAADAAPTITLLAHDGEHGSVVSTKGDLAFRFGDFLRATDAERMRLTADGKLGIGTAKPEAPLDVNGIIRTSKGIQFPDGTVLTSAAGLPGQQVVEDGSAAPGKIMLPRRTTPLPEPGAVATSRPLGPRTNAPDYQFKADSTGVHIGTSTAYGLDVSGDVTLVSDLVMPAASSTTAGVIYAGTRRFLHHTNNRNTFLGLDAGNLTIFGTFNTAVGEKAMEINTYGSQNAALGSDALAVNTIGSYNSAVGESALSDNTEGNGNTAIGTAALTANTSGSTNTAVGLATLFTNTTGSGNTGVGYNALNANTSSYNTATGYLTLEANTTGSWNTAVGYLALQKNTTGNFNIGIGENAGYALTTGCCNIDIGNVGVAGEQQTIRIGNAQTRAFIKGIRGATTASQTAIPVLIDANGQLGTASSSRRSKFDITDMHDATANLMRLRPVTFRYLAYGNDAALQYGLIAEEVADVYPELVARNQDGEIETVMYQFLAPMLLNEVQRQRRTIDELTSAMETLTRRLDAIESGRKQR